MSITDVEFESKVRSARFVPRYLLELQSASGPEELSLMRSRVVDFARKMPFEDEQVYDIELAVGEALTNAFKYGQRNGCSTIRLTAAWRCNALYVSVTDAGCGFDPARVKPAEQLPTLSENGRGIALMRALMDSVKFETEPTGMRVEMIKHFV